MEQQNQQPPQQEQKELSSTKKFLGKHKLPLVVAVAVIILAVAGILLLNAVQPASREAGPAPAPQKSEASAGFAGWQCRRSIKS